MNLKELGPKAAKAADFLKALANPKRLLILCELLDGEQSVTSLQEAVGLSQSALSQHLARLRADDFVKTRREAQTIYYSLNGTDVERILSLLYDIYCRDDCQPAKRVRKAAKPAPRRTRS